MVVARRPRWGAAAVAVWLAAGLLLVLGGGQPAGADGTAGGWVGGNGLYLLSNNATGGATMEVACLDPGRAMPSDRANVKRSELTAPLTGYALFHHTPGADDLTRAALGVWGHTAAELPHNGRTGPVTPTAAVAARHRELLDEASRLAGPYTVTVRVVSGPTAAVGTVAAEVLVRSAAGNPVPGVAVKVSGTGAAGEVSASAARTDTAGKVLARFTLAHSTRGGVAAVASGLAPTTVALFAAETSGYQRVIGRNAAVSVSGAVAVSRPAPPRGTLRVVKVDRLSGATVAGARLEVRQGSGTGPVVARFDSPASGSRSLSLPPGRYVTVETVAPAGYLKDASPVVASVVSGGTVTVKMVDSPKGRLKVVKVDRDTGARLPGVRFHVEQRGKTLASGVTGSDGVWRTAVLDAAVGSTVRVVEDRPLTGYLGAPAREVVLTRDAEGTARVVVENSRKPIPRGKVSVLKTDPDGHPLAGAKFRVSKDGKTLATGTSDARGFWASPVLSTVMLGDRVRIEETAAPEGFQVSAAPVTAVVTTDGRGAGRMTVVNQPLATVAVKKVSAVTGKALAGATALACYATGRTLAGAEKSNRKACPVVGITLPDGSAVDPAGWVLIGKLGPTGPDGRSAPLTAPYLRAGDQVLVAELKAPDGYSLSTVAAVTTRTNSGWKPGCSNAGDAVLGSGSLITCTLADSPLTRVRITKVAVGPDGAPTDETQPAGAVYRILNRDGDTLVPATAPSGADGLIELDLPALVPEEVLTFVEIDSPPGLALDPTPFTGTVAEAADGTYHLQVTQQDRLLEIGTTARAAGGGKLVTPGGVVLDEVAHSGLVPGKAYQLVATLMAIGPDGTVRPTSVTGNTDFSPVGPDGTVDVRLDLPADLPPGRYVVFEQLLLGGAVVAVHQQGDAVEQMVYRPAIETRALDHEDGDKQVGPGAQVLDEVRHIGLEPGRDYLLRASILPVTGSEEVVATAELGFRPTGADGSALVPITLPADLPAGRYVVFEELLLDGTVVAQHRDRNSAAQSFEVVLPPTTSTPVTTTPTASTTTPATTAPPASSTTPVAPPPSESKSVVTSSAPESTPELTVSTTVPSTALSSTAPPSLEVLVPPAGPALPETGIDGRSMMLLIVGGLLLVAGGLVFLLAGTVRPMPAGGTRRHR